MIHRRGSRASVLLSLTLAAGLATVALSASPAQAGPSPTANAAASALEALRGRPFVVSTATWAQQSASGDIDSTSTPVAVGSGAIVKVATTLPGTAPAGTVGVATPTPDGAESAVYSFDVPPIAALPVAGGDVYPVALQALAQQVAKGQKGLDPAALQASWLRTSSTRMTAVLSALSQVGTPYRWGGTAAGGFDCSGLTGFSWATAGVRLKRTSTDQINQIAPRSADALLPGDLVWRPGHIAMYLGVGEFVVDAPQTGKNVGVRSWGRVSRFGSPVAEG